MRRLALIIGLAIGLHAAPTAAQDRPVAVYFAPGADTLSSEAEVILGQVVERYQNTGMAGVVLSGHTDRVGEASANVGLSQRRANAVRAFLGADFRIPDGVIVTTAFGETRPAVDTADGVREPKNNRVEIEFSQGSGW